MTEILLIRHTQAEGNRYRMMQGHWDGNVTDLGWQQIDALAERLRDERIDAVYSSDLYRARMTSTAVTKYHALKLQEDVRLRELDMGPWEAGFFGNILHDYPEQGDNFINHPGKWHIDGAETYADVQARAYPALCEIAARHDGERVAVVSHGVTIRCLMAKITGLPLESVEELPIFSNTAVTTLCYVDGAFTVSGQNDCSHLAAIGAPDWHRLTALRDEAMDLRADYKFYCDAYADSWRAAHGSLKGYDENTYLCAAMEHRACNPSAVLKIFDGEEGVGLVDMDTRRLENENVGWISLIWLREDYRGKGYGIQLLARAIKAYTALGRRELRLCVASENLPAARFYERCGFETIGREIRENGELLVMSHRLGGRKYA